MASKIHRNEEKSINQLIMSGRIVSEIFYNKEIELIDDKKKSKLEAIFVLLVVDERNDKKMPFRVIVKNSTEIYYLKKLATKGCRIVFNGHIESRKRVKSKMKKYFVTRYSTDILLDNIVNIFDTLKEQTERDKMMIKKGEYIARSEFEEYPELSDFDSQY